jgi:hypothetical protein
MANFEHTGSILKCECGGIHDCDRCSYMSSSLFFHQFPSFSCETNSLERYNCKKCSFETYSTLVWIKHSNSLCLKTKEEFEKVTFGKEAKFHLFTEDIQWFKCNYKTNRRYILKRHDRMKHTLNEETSWFRCEQCAYKTKLKCALRRHMTIHKSDEETKWFDCFNCEYRTRRKGNLRLCCIVRLVGTII